MSCMEHECDECGWFTMDNKPREPKYCPNCGSSEIRHYWDEENDHHDED